MQTKDDIAVYTAPTKDLYSDGGRGWSHGIP